MVKVEWKMVAVWSLIWTTFVLSGVALLMAMRGGL